MEDPVMEEVPAMEEDQDPTTEEDSDSDLSGEDSNFAVMEFLASMASNEEVSPETWERLMEEQGQAVFEESENSFVASTFEAVGGTPEYVFGKEAISDFKSNPYIRDQIDKSKLNVHHEAKVRNAFQTRRALGLVNQFLDRTVLGAIRTWTNDVLRARGKAKASKNEFNAYLGLEIAMSLVKFSRMKDYWSSKLFLGSSDFADTMSRDRFLTIRSAIVLRPPTAYQHEVVTSDPLWHCRPVLAHFQKNCTSVATPGKVSALDENAIRCSARSSAVSYMGAKPIRFAIRCYALVCWGSCYMANVVDNGRGNKTGMTPPQRYVQVHPGMRTPFEKAGNNQNFVNPESPTAMWAMMAAHMEQNSPSGRDRRVVYVDNFYTRHNFGEFLKLLSDTKVRITGTVRTNFIDQTNMVWVAQALKRLSDKPRGSWILVAAYNKAPDIDDQKKKHKKDMDRLPKGSEKPKFKPTLGEQANNCGFVLVKDKQTVIMYTNDLASTPERPICDGWIEKDRLEDPAEKSRLETAIKCVHGLVDISRWVGTEYLHRTLFAVPAIFVAYNIFMNSVDRFDQKRTAVECCRREKRVHMSIWTALLDWSVLNAQSLLATLELKFPDEDNIVNAFEFKRRLSAQLCERWRRRKSLSTSLSPSTLSPSTLSRISDMTPDESNDSSSEDGSTDVDTYCLPLVEGIPDTQHTLWMGKKDTRHRVACFVCRVYSRKYNLKIKQKKTDLYCKQCQLAFHLPCFNYLHYRAEVPSIIPEDSQRAICMAVTMYHGAKGTRKRKDGKARLRRTNLSKIDTDGPVPSVLDNEESEEE